MSTTPAPVDYQLIGVAEDGNTGDLLTQLDQRQARIRLQALVSEWLRMENLVVLTGSGTSVTSGGKTMLNLEQEVLGTIELFIDCPAPIAALIVQRRADVATGDAIGFEAWLSFVSNALVITEAQGAPFSSVGWTSLPPPKPTDLKWFVDRLRMAIYAECALVLPDFAAAGARVPPHLAFLSKLVARDSNLGRSHLFTLNYDTLFEQALELLGVQYFDGFTGRAAARFDPAVYGLDIYYPGEIAEGRVRRFDKFLHFYKLHGSIHWFEHGAEMRARHPDLAPYAAYHRKARSEKAVDLQTLAAQANSVGILPTANKFAETLAMPYAHLFRSFQMRLGIPQTFLVVLGYGFGDDHVTRIIENALMNPSLVMLVVEPNPNSPVIDRVRRYKDLGKRAFVLSPTVDAFSRAPYTLATFDDFAGSIMPDVQWLDDYLRLRRFEKQIAASDHQSADAPTIGTA